MSLSSGATRREQALLVPHRPRRFPGSVQYASQPLWFSLMVTTTCANEL